ncbi:MAG: prokaryotic E2 ligase family D protein [Pyrinomonadaceae bacterium]|nr:prokaryotic E2 ligase family D protein [Pyrinomonadaceae bacterium]
MRNHTVPSDASAALYFLPGQYLFESFGENRNALKALSSTQVTRAFHDLQTDTGWIDRRILRYREATDGNAILSYLPASERTITVVFPGDRTKALTLPLPTLILLGKGKDYYLWAAPTSKVTRNTPIAVAPLPNIGSGKICFGKNEVPETHPSTIGSVWQLIFDAPFNGDHSTGRCQTENDVRDLLEKLATNKVKKFPTPQLIMSSSTIEDAWASIVERTRYDSRF